MKITNQEEFDRYMIAQCDVIGKRISEKWGIRYGDNVANNWRDGRWLHCSLPRFRFSLDEAINVGVDIEHFMSNFLSPCIDKIVRDLPESAEMKNVTVRWVSNSYRQNEDGGFFFIRFMALKGGRTNNQQK